MFKWLSSVGVKFFLAGKGLSFRAGKFIGEAILVGAFTGFVVVGFRYLIQLGKRYIMEGIGHHEFISTLPDGAAFVKNLLSGELLGDPRRWILVTLPAIGALLGHLLIRRFGRLEHARGTDSAIRAYHRGGGRVPVAVIPVKSVASVLTVGSGGSAGYEGPVTLIGAACGSAIASALKLSTHARRILMASGLAAGIAALFQAPLAGAIFGFEIFYSSSDVEYETVLPCFIASAVSYTIFACFFGWDPLFTMPPECVYDSGLKLVPYLVLALAVTFGVRFYIGIFRAVETAFTKSLLPAWLKVVVGGLATGVIGFFFPDILGSSYSIIEASFTAGQSDIFQDYSSLTIAGFFSFFLMKAVATSMTVGSGGSGGVFAPALVCGGTLGAAVGLFFAKVMPETVMIRPAAFALVGMAGFMASAIRTPLTAIVMVAEISGNHSLLLPAMWVCGFSFWLNNGWSLYRSQVHSRESSPVHG